MRRSISFVHPLAFGALCGNSLRQVVRVVVCALLAPFLILSTAFAQEAETDDEVLRVNTDLLVFPIRVRNKDKRPVETLTEPDLILTDKDKVTNGLYLRRGIDRVALIFALDQSGSTRQIISEQRDAALGLLSKFGARSQVAIIRFASTPSLVTQFGTDISVAREAFEFPAGENQRTAIFDAATLAVTSFNVLPRVRSERRIVILISDGLDNASKTKVSRVIETAATDRVSFYVIHIPLFTPGDGRLIVRPPAGGFRDLAEKTGGKYFLVRDARSALAPQTDIDLAPIFQAIEDDLKSQFLLGFYLKESANDGRRHQFSLTMPRGLEYQVSGRGFARKHEFFVANPRRALTAPD
jgi:VWFA-related protein